VNDLTIDGNRRDTSGGRFYMLHDRETRRPISVPSVTTILGVIAKPALIHWAANQERTLAFEAAYEAQEELKRIEGVTRDTFVAILNAKLGHVKAFRRKMDAAAAIGTQAHRAAEWTLRKLAGDRVGSFPALSPEAKLGFEAFERWMAAHHVEVICVEQVVGSIDHEFAGTLDAFLLVDGVPTLCDLKTSKAIYAEHYVQLAAYDAAVREMVAKDGWPVPVPEAHLVIRLPKTANDPEFEAHVPPAPVAEMFPTFMAARRVWADLFAQDGWARREAA
jgi:hypothetical protein